MKVVLITDQHLGAREGSSIILEHQRAFYENTFFPFLESTGIKTVITLGDFYDKRKYTNNYIIDQSKRIFFDRLQELDVQTYMIVGNHDSFFKNTLTPNTIRTLTPEYDNVTVIDDPLTVDVNGFQICMMPWMCSDNYTRSMDELSNTKSDICMGHFEIEGFWMYRGVESHGGLKQSLFNKFDVVFSGHYHHRSNKGNITYLGTPYELTWQDYGDPKGFHVFDLETRELTFIENPNKLFVKLEYNDLNQEPVDLRSYNLKDTYVKVIVVNKTDYYKFDIFMNLLYNKGCVDIKIIEDIGDFSAGEMDEDIKLEDTHSVLNHYIDSLDLELDRSLVKSYIQSLFTEAVNLDIA